MPGTPMEQNNESLDKLQEDRPPNAKCEPVVREITQTDRLNKRLLVSLLERMNKSEGEFDKYMDKGKQNNQNQDDSDF